MTQKQIDFYNSLSENDQYILKLAAIKMIDIRVIEISKMLDNIKISDKQIRMCLGVAFQKGLIVASKLGMISYNVSYAFLIYIYPQLEAFIKKPKKVEQHSYYFESQPQSRLWNFLYYLLYYEENKLRAAEEKLLTYHANELSEILNGLLELIAYRPVISLIDTKIILMLLSQKMNDVQYSLSSLYDFQHFIQDLTPSLSPKQVPYISNLELQLKEQMGRLSEIHSANSKLPNPDYFMMATYSLIKKDFPTALANFSKGIKSQQNNYKGSQLPVVPHVAFFYLAALMCLPLEETTSVFLKIQYSLNKKIFTPFDPVFRTVVAYGLNDKSGLDEKVANINNIIQQDNQDYTELISFLILYLVDKKPNEPLLSNMSKTVAKAFTSGYLMLAYEAAFALDQWTNDEKVMKLYEDIAKEVAYPPVLSTIVRQQEWEKSLSMLLSMNLDKPISNINKESNKSRIVYFLNPKIGSIQPVIQTHLAKGGWSKGRNIALKTFFEGKSEGMTEQDFRVAKCVRVMSNYWGSDEYKLPEQAIKELLGHPYVFLDGTVDIPIELIAAQPVIQVVKSAKGYALSTNIKDDSQSFAIEKETNTRYKVYDLTSRQRQIIQIMNQQKIVVPELGKEKLIQLLGGFSRHMTVYSDLLATEREGSNVKEVDPDSRIRVQLLPFGDGLKAELFAKPFGTLPPYCKPGKGGKVLITDDHGQQLQVKRDLSQELEIANALMNDIQSLESLDISDDLIAFDEPMDSLHLLDILATHQDKCVVEWPEGEKYKIRGSVNFSNLNLRLKSKSNWFELQGELKVDEETVVTIQQLLALTAKGHDRFIELEEGQFLALSDQLKRQLEEVRAFSVLSKDGVKINKFASVALGDFFEEVDNLKADKAWKDFRKQIESVQETETPIPTNLQAELRPYQEDGFHWLAHLATLESGACLADDMGLGKTIQTLAILLHSASQGPALVVCPVSVLSNWVNETARFAPTLCVKTLTNNNRQQTLQSLESGDILVTSYGLLQSEEKALAEILFSTIVLDEAHTIKNYATKTSKAAMQLQASFRIALTGTPIQNHLGEIWNLFNFVNPGLLGTLQHFTDMFIKPDNESSRRHLKKLITPFILRRTKSAVLDELPPKTEIVKKVPLSDDEMAFYEALRRQAIVNLESDDAPQGTKHLKALAEITRLRQACCNPALVDSSLSIPSTKLATFLEIVAELTENKHRALVFSQFVTHLSLVRAALDKQGYKYQYLDGSTPVAEREKGVKKFQSGEGVLFLISLKAGGLGLNLTAADYVIHLDPWWNPAVEDQASDRAHRIGQNRPVTIYRLVAENTIEEKIIQLHNTKRDLADSLLEGSDQSAKLSMTELLSLIKEQD